VLEHAPAAETYKKGSWGPEDALALPGALGWRLQDESG
jgi:glucose-6-phosphate 1-dehydrogenase